MDCAEEVAILKREIGPLVGTAENLAFDILRGKMTVLPTGHSVSSKTVLQAVSRTGTRAEAWTDAVGGAEDDFWQRRGRTTLTAISASRCLLAFCFKHGWEVACCRHLVLMHEEVRIRFL